MGRDPAVKAGSDPADGWGDQEVAMRRDDGFTMVEIVVVLAIIGILTTIGAASYTRMHHRAADTAAHLDLATAVKVQMLHHLEVGEFTEDAAVLRDLEPNLRYSATGDDGALVVVVEPPLATSDVCIFVRSDSGTWFAIAHSTDRGDRFGTSLPQPCTPGAVGAWSTVGW